MLVSIAMRPLKGELCLHYGIPHSALVFKGKDAQEVSSEAQVVTLFLGGPSCFSNDMLGPTSWAQILGQCVAF